MHAHFMQTPQRETHVSNFIRQFHCWTSTVFVVTVIATTIELAQPQPIAWIAYAPLAPLALLALVGIYPFAEPYFARRGAEN